MKQKKAIAQYIVQQPAVYYNYALQSIVSFAWSLFVLSAWDPSLQGYQVGLMFANRAAVRKLAQADLWQCKETRLQVITISILYLGY